MSTRAWSTRQLRRMPELRRFDPDDPFARRWASPWNWGWWLRVGCGAGFGAAVLLVCGLLAPAVLGMGSQRFPSPTAPRSAFLPTLLAAVGLVAAGLAAWAGYAMERSIQRTMLRAELRSRGIPMCIACGYDGGDAASPRCPECGAAYPEAS